MLSKNISSLKQKLQNEEGLSVIELMIGTVILLTVSAVVATVIVTTSGQISQTAEDTYYKNQITLAGKIVAKTIGQSKSLIAFSTNSIELETQDNGTVEIFTAGATCSLTAKIYDKDSLLTNEINIFDTLDSCAIFTNNDPIFEVDLSYTRGEKTFTTTIEAAINNSRETKDSGVLTDESITSLLAYTASFNNGQPYVFNLNTPNEQTPEIQVSGSAPFTYSLHSGALPEVLSLNETTGIITGPTTWNLSDETNLFNTALTLKIEDSMGIQILLPIILQSPTIQPIQATGGIITEQKIGNITYRIHSFTSPGTTPFNVTSLGNTNGEVQYLVVGGGGAGGSSPGGSTAGGGGAGHMIEGTTTVTTGVNPVIVGQGGQPNNSPRASRGGNGGESSFRNISAPGGGGGGTWNTTDGLILPTSGGSGGGGSAGVAARTSNGASAALGQGNPGGNGILNNTDASLQSAGGGGGAGTAGQNGSTTKGGDGGEGLTSSISGTTQTYAAGGGGGKRQAIPAGTAGGIGGSNIGGNGGVDSQPPTSGQPNTGSGGGGAGNFGLGGEGGSGIVIIRYPVGTITSSGVADLANFGYNLNSLTPGLLNFTRAPNQQVFNPEGAIFANPNFSITSGSLPNGVTFNSTTGEIFGPSDWGFNPVRGGGSNGNSVFRGIVETSTGDFIATGDFTGSATFGSTTLSSNGSNDLIVAKINKVGDWEWAVQAGGTGIDRGWDLEATSDGGAIIVGDFTGNVTFGSTTLSSSGSQDIFVAKISPEGTWQWATRAGGAGGDRPFGIDIGPGGQTYVTGFFTGTASFGSQNITSAGGQDIFVAKISSITGAWEWVQRAGGTAAGEAGRDVAVDNNGNVIVVGYFNGTATFGSTSLTSAGSDEIFVAKLNSSGTWQWARRAGGTGSDSTSSVTVLPDNSIAFTGYFQNTASFGNNITLQSGGGNDFYVAKIDTNGNWQWAVRGGGSSPAFGSKILSDSEGSIYVWGDFQGTAIFGSTLYSSQGSNDVILHKLTSGGTWLWSASGGGTGNNRGIGATLTQTGDIFVSGLFRNSATLGSQTIISSGNDDAFIARVNGAGTWSSNLTPETTTATIMVSDGGDVAAYEVTISTGDSSQALSFPTLTYDIWQDSPGVSTYAYSFALDISSNINCSVHSDYSFQIQYRPTFSSTWTTDIYSDGAPLCHNQINWTNPSTNNGTAQYDIFITNPAKLTGVYNIGFDFNYSFGAGLLDPDTQYEIRIQLYGPNQEENGWETIGTFFTASDGDGKGK